MVDVRRVDLPGLGVLHSFVTRDSREISVVAHRTGTSDLMVRADGEGKPTVARLDADEAHTLADLLGGTRIIESIAELDAMPGVPIGWVSIDEGDPAAGRTLGSIEAFASNGVKIVAVVRDDEVHASVSPDFTIQAGDQLVAVGPSDRIASAFRSATTRGAEPAQSPESDA